MKRVARTSVLLLTLLSIACGPARDPLDPASDPSRSAGNGASPSATPAVEATVDGSFDVGGHALYIRCVGSGSPTIVYLHGYIFDPAGGGSQNAGQIPDLLANRYQVCVYDRANVGRSDAVEGPLTGRSSITDLDALLDAAEVDGPYLLVGASFGGLLAYMYAATNPKDVVGLVLLDPNLPGYHEEAFDWKATTEQIDQTAASREASNLEGHEPDIPVTLVGLENPEIDFVSSADQYQKLKEQILRAQQRFLDLFPQGELVIVDAPHYMEPVIPDRIAEEISSVAERS
jgi:pimeloyl-ACP methyl ester carboxylesterase